MAVLLLLGHLVGRLAIGAVDAEEIADHSLAPVVQQARSNSSRGLARRQHAATAEGRLREAAQRVAPVASARPEHVPLVGPHTHLPNTRKSPVTTYFTSDLTPPFKEAALDQFLPAQIHSTRNPLQTAMAQRVEELPTGPSEAPLVTLHLDDVEVRQVLEMFSRRGPISILVSPNVQGRVTANLRAMPLNEAVHAVLRLCNLVAHHEGDTLYVYTAEELPQLDRMVRVFPLDYASAVDVMPAVQGLLSPAGQAFMTQAVPTDNRRTHDVILVEDLPSYVNRIEHYLAEVNRPPRQVLIEAHVLQVTLKEDQVHGINYDYLFNIANGTGSLVLNGFADPFASPAFFASIDTTDLDVLLQALKSTTDAKTLAAPKVVALDGQQARIQIGEKLGYRITTATQTTSLESVEFLEVGIVLDVVPRIGQDNQVLLQVKPKVSDGRVDSLTGLPEEETTEVETNLMLEDGRGMVIGGLIQEKISDSQAKVPYLGDLFLVGRLFQRRNVAKTRTEIIITLVPRVLPYALDYHSQEEFEFMRGQTPVLRGALQRYPRPWEPRFHDAIENPRPLHLHGAHTRGATHSGFRH